MGLGKRKGSLRKSKQVFHHTHSLYQKQGSSLSTSHREQVEKLLANLAEAIRVQDREQAHSLSQELEALSKQIFRKTIKHYFQEVLVAIVIAFAIAVVIRQSVFELYTIPTGSMRPNFREGDHLIVSKTTFGLNVPMTPAHIIMEPEFIHRGEVITFTTEDMDFPDQDAIYLGFIPYKKRLIKRCVGLPGDTIYFYGGRLYGIDRSGEEILAYRNDPWLQKLEYIPFNQFEGKLSSEVDKATRQTFLNFSLFNKVRGQIASNGSQWNGLVWNGESFSPEKLHSNSNTHQISRYSDFAGISNFAMTRLFTKDELHLSEASPQVISSLKPAPLYLELSHHPRLDLSSSFVDLLHGKMSHLKTHTSILPMSESALNEVMNAMYTSRFTVKNGQAFRNTQYSSSESSSVAMPGVPDGNYEFIDGIAYSVAWKGVTTPLDQDHPLYSHDPVNIQRLYNLGMEMMNAFAIQAKGQYPIPARYGYFRQGDFYLMNHKVLSQDDPKLQAFISNELTKEKRSSNKNHYTPFIDINNPMQEDTLNKELIRAKGLHIPEGHYLCLGDNHAGSGDCRTFGFVPEENLRGTPAFILWPTGSRWGLPAQNNLFEWSLSTLIVWGFLICVISIGWYYQNRQYATCNFIPIAKKQNENA